jgi:hypothetical protein
MNPAFLRNLLGEGEGGKQHANVTVNGNGKRMLEEDGDERSTKKRCYQVVE